MFVAFRIGAKASGLRQAQASNVLQAGRRGRLTLLGQPLPRLSTSFSR
jgi:hypothetical protein